MIVEAEGPSGITPPPMIRVRGLEGIFGVRLMTWTPPLPPVAPLVKMVSLLEIRHSQKKGVPAGRGDDKNGQIPCTAQWKTAR